MGQCVSVCVYIKYLVFVLTDAHSGGSNDILRVKFRNDQLGAFIVFPFQIIVPLVESIRWQRRYTNIEP